MTFSTIKINTTQPTNFMKWQKKNKTIMFYSLYHQLKNTGLIFNKGPNVYKVSISEDLQTIEKSLSWRKESFKFKLL